MGLDVYDGRKRVVLNLVFETVFAVQAVQSSFKEKILSNGVVDC